MRDDEPPQVVCLVGSFDPNYLGYTTPFEKASELGDKLVVLVRSDAWLENNRGFVLLGECQRKELLESMDCVDRVVITHHDEKSKDQSVSKELEKIKPDVFVKLYSESIREKEVCEEIGCEIVNFEVKSDFLSDLLVFLKYYFKSLFSKKERKEEATFKKIEDNPILEPSEKSWEFKATFNGAAVEEDEEIHILYRAVGKDDRSVLGHAVSENGTEIKRKSDQPAYAPEQPSGKRSSEKGLSDFPDYSSGGGWRGGAEDPRLTAIDSKIYMTYTSFDGTHLPHVSLTSIDKEDFVNEDWNWSPPIRLSPEGEIHKNWVVFPDKINGKFAVLHSLSPKIQISYFNDLEDEDDYPIRSFYEGKGMAREDYWDGWVRGAGPPPLKTEQGWLLFYHGTESPGASKYKVGAFLLDLKEPTEILARSSEPLLEPEEDYENERGMKPGVIYACGAGILDGKLFLYYGGADTFLCVAASKLDKVLEAVKRDKLTLDHV